MSEVGSEKIPSNYLQNFESWRGSVKAEVGEVDKEEVELMNMEMVDWTDLRKVKQRFPALYREIENVAREFGQLGPNQSLLDNLNFTTVPDLIASLEANLTRDVKGTMAKSEAQRVAELNEIRYAVGDKVIDQAISNGATAESIAHAYLVENVNAEALISMVAAAANKNRKGTGESNYGKSV